MEIRSLEQSEKIDSFIQKIPHCPVLQSTLWAAVQQKEGRPFLYIGIYNDAEDLVGIALLIEYPLPFCKTYWYSPRPIIDPAHVQNYSTYIKKRLNKKCVLFWKIEGITKLPTAPAECTVANAHPLQYQETFVIDITKPQDELLCAMKPKTRYNIRLAEKKAVHIRWSKNVEDVDVFYNLLSHTAKRQHIAIHSKDHYRNIVDILGKKNAAELAIATYHNTPIAANLLTFFGDTATYLHGGSEDVHREKMAPYLLQWESIREARRRGCLWYDMGGCATAGWKRNAWAGITRFKAGFGGELHRFGETYDVVFNKPWYRLYKWVQQIKK